MDNEAEDYWLDREASKKITGIFANRVYAQPLGDGMVRINFGEIIDADDPAYHTAIVVTAQQAVTFAQLIYNIGTSTLEAEAAHWAAQAQQAADEAAAAAQEAANEAAQAVGATHGIDPR